MSFQAKLTTKLDEYSIGDAIIELRNSVTSSELNQIVISLLSQLDRDGLEDVEKKSFDFIVGGRLLKTSIADHFELYADELDASEILNEKLVEIEYTIPLESPKPLDEIKQNDWISCVDANETYLITGSYDNSICIYSLKDRKRLLTLTEGHNQPITSIKFIPSSQLDGASTKSKSKVKTSQLYFLSSAFDETARLWSFDAIKLKCDELVAFRGHKRSVDCLDVQQDLLATGGYDKTIKIWSALPGPDDQELNGQATQNDDLDGVNITGKRKKVRAKQSSSKNVDGSALINRNPTITMTGHKDGIRGVRWINKGGNLGPDSLASCSLDGLIILWDIESGSETRKFVSAKPMLGLDYSKDANLLLTASCDRFVRLWDMRSPDESRASAVFSSHSAWVSKVSFCKSSSANAGSSSRQNNFVSGGYDNLVKLWDLRSSKACLYDLIGHHDRVFDVNNNNPNIVVSGSADSTVRLYSLTKQQVK